MKDEVNNVESMNGDKIKDDHQKDTSPKPKALNQYSPSNLFLNHSSMYSIISTAEHEKSLQEKKSKYNEHCVAAVIALVGQLATLASWSELNTFGRAANVVILAFFAVSVIVASVMRLSDTESPATARKAPGTVTIPMINSVTRLPASTFPRVLSMI